MPSVLGRTGRARPRAMKPRADLHPIELLDSIGKDARAEALADTSQAPPGVTSSDKTRVVAQEMLDNEWDGLLGKMGRGFVAQRANVKDFLMARYYGHDLDRIVDAAEDARAERRPSHLHPDNSPRDRLSETFGVFRGKGPNPEGEGSLAVQNAGIFSSFDDIKSLTGEGINTTNGIESAHRGVENHEFGHFMDLQKRDPFQPFQHTLFEMKEEPDGAWTMATPRNKAIRDSLVSRVGPQQANERVLYAQTVPELVANIGSHKRNEFALAGDVPMDRESVRAMYEDMAEDARNFDISEPGFTPEDYGIDPGSAGAWDFYGPDPKGEYGPRKGKSLRGATETRMNLGNIFLEADPELQELMITDFLRSVDNKDIRKSLLARTA